jgi:hypothetical protein
MVASSKTSQQGRGNQNGRRTGASHFSPIPSADQITLPFDDGQIETIEGLLDIMSSTKSEAGVASMAVAAWLAAHPGKAQGHQWRMLTDLLRHVVSNSGATDCAHEYAAFCAHTDNEEAETTGQLVRAEDFVLQYLHGTRIDLGRLEELLKFIASTYKELPGCTKLEGSARALLAFVQLRRAVSQRGRFNITLYKKSLSNMREAIQLLGMGYEIEQGVTTIIETLDHIHSATTSAARV